MPNSQGQRREALPVAEKRVAAGQHIAVERVWSSAGTTSLLDVFIGNSPGHKGVGNSGETIYSFNRGHDDVNLSKFADGGFAGGSQAIKKKIDELRQREEQPQQQQQQNTPKPQRDN